MTQQGYLRLATNRSVFKAHALTLSGAWQAYDVFRSDPRVAYAEESANLETHWRGYTGNQSFSPKVWNDAYPAAFAVAGNLALVTFDKGFSQYPNVTSTILS